MTDYKFDGNHDLRIAIGGSAGHSGNYGVKIFEGYDSTEW